MNFFPSPVSIQLNTYIKYLRKYERGHPKLQINMPGKTFLRADYFVYPILYFTNFRLEKFIVELRKFDFLNKNSKVLESTQIDIWRMLHKTQKEEAFDYMIETFDKLSDDFKDDIFTYGYLPNPKLYPKYKKSITKIFKDPIDLDKKTVI